MDQVELFHEDIYEALRTCIQALGGPKKVGSVLWPEPTVEKAGNRLNDCINVQRREQLNPEQVLWILTESRKIGCHAAMYFIADNCDYQRPEPIEPEDEQAKLMREFIQMGKRMEKISAQMSRMTDLKEVVSR